MFKILCCLAGVVAVHASLSETQNKIVKAKELCASCDDLVEPYLDMLDVPGCAVGVIVNGEVVFQKAYGLRDIDRELKMTTKTLVPVGSASKAFTSMLLGTLVDDGTLSWDDPIADHVPHFKLQDPYTTYTITIRDYLTHLSGYARNDGIWYNLNLSREELVRRLRYVTPAFPLRERFYYQNIGYAVAAHAAECATNRSYEELLQERILNPLGMTTTTASMSKMKANEDHATGYRFYNHKLHAGPAIDAHAIAPGGGLNSNLEDMLLWASALLKQGCGLVEKRTWNEIITPHVVSDSITSRGYGVEEYVPMEAYGLGWFLISYRNHQAFFHGGNIEGFSSNIIVFPKDNIAIVVLTNKHFTPFPYFLTTLLADKLLHLEPVDWFEKYGPVLTNLATKEEFLDRSGVKRQENTTPSHPLAAYQGTYLHPAFGKVDIELRKDHLVACFNNLCLPLSHWHYDVFAVHDHGEHIFVSGLKLQFQENVYGDITTLLIPLEPASDDIVFTKKTDSYLFDPLYLNRFVGTYTYYGFGFHVEQRESGLVVKALGQPDYHLIPQRMGLFKVKDYEGAMVEFVMDNGEVLAVKLIQGDNTTYIAPRQK